MARPESGRPEPGRPDSSRTDREAAGRRRVEESERVRSVQVDAEREATEQAARALAEEQRLTVAQSQASERLKHAEAAMNEITRRTLELDQRRLEARSRLDQQARTLQSILPIMVRMAANPVEAILATRIPPEEAIRGLAVLRFLGHQANDDARGVARDREALDSASREVTNTAPQLAAAEAARSYEADALARQLAATREQRQGAEQDAADAARRAAGEAARAQTLRSMLQILETQRRLEEARAREDALRAERAQKTTEAEAARLRQAATSRPTGSGALANSVRPAGQLMSPVAGVLVRGWGDPQDGETATGQSYQTELGARVMAPCGGTVAFAESFRGYGLLVIIDCGGGYHTVLSGLASLAVVPGRAIQPGDAVGTMRSATKTALAGTADAGTVEPGTGGPREAGIGETDGGAIILGRPVLYLELRKSGRAINPAPWLKPQG